MRTLGILGGMSWESTALYYRLLNEGVRDARRDLSSAPLLIDSVDFAPLAVQQAAGDWEGIAADLGARGKRLVQAGAQGLLLATNSMHRVAPEIEAAAGLSLLHIADPTGAALQARGARRPLLLGTAFTMEQAFYRERLAARFGLAALIPEPEERAEVHRVIYEELCRGRVRETSRHTYRAIIAAAAGRGADSVILGCTEITLLITQADSLLPLVDTTALHAKAAVAWILAAA